MALLVLVVAAGLVGEDSPTLSLAPTFVYVLFWLGVPLLSVLLGDVWRVLNPWRAAADAVAYLTARAGEAGALRSPIPSGARCLGVTAASSDRLRRVVKLAYPTPDDPRVVAASRLSRLQRITVRRRCVRAQVLVRERRRFGAYFGLFARMAPFADREGSLRPPAPFSALAKGGEGRDDRARRRRPRLGRDHGVSRTNWWEAPTAHRAGRGGDGPEQPRGLLGCIPFAASTYLAAVAVARRLAGRSYTLMVWRFSGQPRADRLRLSRGR